MALVFTMPTAAEIHRSHYLQTAQSLSYRFRARRIPLSRCNAPTAGEVAYAKETALFECSDPLHVLVDNASKRRTIKGARCHVDQSGLGVLPLRQNGLYVISPEAVFLQAANMLDTIALLKLGFELCGSYYLADDDPGFMPRDPLTRASVIRRFVNDPKQNGTRGIKRARKAARYLLDGSASPRETSVALLISLPISHGGYGNPLPRLNHRINIPAHAQHLFPKRYYVCDLCWPEHGVALEYDSDAYHTGPQRIANDSSRRSALALLGIDTISVTNHQVTHVAEMDRIARLLGRKLNHPLRANESTAFRERQRILRSQVLS